MLYAEFLSVGKLVTGRAIQSFIHSFVWTSEVVAEKQWIRLKTYQCDQNKHRTNKSNAGREQKKELRFRQVCTDEHTEHVSVTGYRFWVRFRTYGRTESQTYIFFSVDFIAISVSTYQWNLTRVTAVARKRSRSYCQKCRWQVTAKHAYTLRMWLCMKRHGAWLYGVHRTCAKMAAVSRGTSHASVVSTPLLWIFKNALNKASHSCRITCERSESARERRIAL